MTAPVAAVFSDWMAHHLPALPSRMAVAVSGGADSMALAWMAHEWAAARGIALHALTVDHRLRPESTDEARQVAAWMAARGIPHHILTWEHDAPPAANRQAAARDARHRLMAEWCRAHDVAYLLLAHHRDDQAETFLIRLQRGSGVDGLAAMRPVAQREGITLLRPLLDTPKAVLVEFLQTQAQQWVEDPSNRDPHYTRTQARALLAQGWLDAATLSATADHMARARDFLERETAKADAACLTWHDEGYITLDYPAFAALHEELRLRLLAKVFRHMNASAYRPRFAELKALHDALPNARTLAGCQFVPLGDTVRIQREAAAAAGPTGSAGLWDGRFRLRFGADCPQATVAALGANGWALLAADAPELAKRIRLPKALLHTLPALWHLETPLAVPHIGYVKPGAQASWLAVEAFPARNGELTPVRASDIP